MGLKQKGRELINFYYLRTFPLISFLTALMLDDNEVLQVLCLIMTQNKRTERTTALKQIPGTCFERR